MKKDRVEEDQTNTLFNWVR